MLDFRGFVGVLRGKEFLGVCVCVKEVLHSTLDLELLKFQGSKFRSGRSCTVYGRSLELRIYNVEVKEKWGF